MPRPSYEEHRARKRRGSFESETDAGSIASFTTHQSSSSFQPSYTYASSSRLTVPKPRTLSSTSASSSVSPSLHPIGAARKPPYPSRVGVSLNTDEAALKRGEARRKRREERDKKSTLRGEEYDTRLRRVVRWISKKGWRGRSIALLAVLWASLRMDMERDRLSRDLTLHRYHFETTTSRIPHMGGRVAGLSDRSVLALMVVFNVGLELVLWCYGIIQWTRKQGAQGGRSWRSQAIATISILLAPGFFISHDQFFVSSQIPLGLAALGITFLTYGADQPATSAILLAAILDSRWGLFLGIFYVFLLGRCLSRKPIDGAKLVWHIAVTHIALFNLKRIMQGRFKTSDKFNAADGFMVKWFTDSMLKTDTSRLCNPHVPNLWCTTDIMFRWTTLFTSHTIDRIASSLVVVSLAPIVGMVFYVAYSSRPTAALSIQPGANLLPLALFTSSLSLILLLPGSNPEALVVPLLPLSMMSCMRGGKDDMGDGAEWEWTVLLHSVVTFYLAATGRAGARSFAGPAIGLWNYLLSSQGPKRKDSQLRKYRETIERICMGLFAITFLTDPSRIPLWEEGWSFLVFSVLVAAWGWGMSRLYLTAWASGALGRRGL